MEWAPRPEEIGRSVLLLFLGMFGGVISKGLMNCKIMKYVTEKIWVKHLIFAILIVFAVGFAGEKPRTAGTIVWTAVLIYVGFMMLMKSYPLVSAFSIAFLLIMFVALEAQKFGIVETEEESSNLSPVVMFSAILSGVTLVFGFGFYMYKQWSEHPKDFSFISFFFGTNKCTGGGTEMDSLVKM